MPHQLKPRKYLPLPYAYVCKLLDRNGFSPQLKVIIGERLGYEQSSEWLLVSKKVPGKVKRIIRNFHLAGWADAVEIFLPPSVEEIGTVCPYCEAPRIPLMVQCLNCFRRYDGDLEFYESWRERLERSPHYQPQ